MLAKSTAMWIHCMRSLYHIASQKTPHALGIAGLVKHIVWRTTHGAASLETKRKAGRGRDGLSGESD
nr:MAG TPA: hypothetical protein [Caudoviricetes sp.]